MSASGYLTVLPGKPSSPDAVDFADIGPKLVY